LYLAFLIDTERDDNPNNDSNNDGIWLYQLGDGARQIFGECPPAAQTACIVDFGGEPSRYNSLHFEWNSRSDALLVEVLLTEENRRAFKTVSINANLDQPTHTYRYDFASWSWDGRRVLASGGGEDGRVGLRWIDPASGGVQLVMDSGSQSLWLQDAVERPNGQIVALGSVNGAISAQRLYDGSGTPLTAQIGFGAPEQVKWSPDRSTVLVVVNESGVRHYYVAEVSGAVREITASIAGALAVEWVGGVPPATTDTSETVPTPTLGLQSRYGLNINQQVQVIVPAGVNLREQPSTAAMEIALINTFDYVVIIGGPVEGEGTLWWLVQTGSGQVGWAAESFNGVQLLSTRPQ
jgi:hypothetical protein